MNLETVGIIWVRPLWLILLPLLLAAIFWIARQPRTPSHWQKKLPSALHKALLTQPKHANEKIKWLLISLTLSLTCIALAGPYRVIASDTAEEFPAVMVFPLSDAMLATDWSPNRLQYLREQLIQQLPQSSISLGWVVYAGSAHVLLPPTQDLTLSRHLLRSLSPSIMPKAGQQADLGVAAAQQLLSKTPHNPIILFTDRLTAAEQQAIIQRLDIQANPLYLVPIGTEQGSPYLKDGQLARDAEDQILLAKLQLASLQTLAKQPSVQLIHLQQLPLLFEQLAKQASQQKLQPQPLPVISWLLLCIVLLIALGARQGWLLVLLLWIDLPHSEASYPEQLWLRADQQAYRLLESDPAQAAELFVDRRWKAVAHFQAGQYLLAAELFAAGSLAEDMYNQGLALFMAGELEAAAAAFAKALERQPDLSAARHNLQLTEQAIAQLNPSPAKPKPAVEAPTAVENIAVEQLPFSQQTAENASVKGLQTPLTTELSAFALELWLEQIPDNPSALLKKKFRLELQSEEAR